MTVALVGARDCPLRDLGGGPPSRPSWKKAVVHDARVDAKRAAALLDAMMVSREQRLAPITASILRVSWYVVFIGAFLMIAFLWMLHMELVPQIILGGIIAFFLGVMIFLISKNRPLKGAVSVRPDSFQSVYDLVRKWDEPA